MRCQRLSVVGLCGVQRCQVQRRLIIIVLQAGCLQFGICVIYRLPFVINIINFSFINGIDRLGRAINNAAVIMGLIIMFGCYINIFAIKLYMFLISNIDKQLYYIVYIMFELIVNIYIDLAINIYKYSLVLILI